MSRFDCRGLPSHDCHLTNSMLQARAPAHPKGRSGTPSTQREPAQDGTCPASAWLQANGNGNTWTASRHQSMEMAKDFQKTAPMRTAGLRKTPPPTRLRSITFARESGPPNPASRITELKEISKKTGTPAAEASVGVDSMQRNFEPMRQQVEAWQRSELTDVTTKVVIYDAFIEVKLEARKHLLRTVHDLYFEPKYEEFRPRTIWSLSNAFTSAFKKSTDSQFNRHGEAGRIPARSPIVLACRAV